MHIIIVGWMNGTKIEKKYNEKKVVTWKGVFIFAFDNCAIIGPIVENFHLLCY